MNTKNIKTVIIPLSFRHPIYDSGCRGAYLRFLAGIYGESKEYSVVIQTAGYSKKSPKSPDSLHPTSLSEAMHQKLEEEMHPWTENFIARPMGYSTRDEIRFGFKSIRDLGIADNNTPVHVIISSNFLHLVRIRWYVSMYKPKAWTVSYKTADHEFSFVDKIMEIPKHIEAMMFMYRRYKAYSRLMRYNTR